MLKRKNLKYESDGVQVEEIKVGGRTETNLSRISNEDAWYQHQTYIESQFDEPERYIMMHESHVSGHRQGIE